MSDDNKLEIKATILGEPLKLVLPSMGWTFNEALAASEATNGLGTDEILDRCLAGDPMAWLAVLRVSYMREGRPFPSEEIGEVNMASLTQAFNTKVDELLGEESPPTSPSGNGSSKQDEPSVPELALAPDSA